MDDGERTTNYGLPKNRISDLGYTYKVQDGYNGIGRYHKNLLDIDVIEIEYTL
jgi:hypothetical protein